MKLYLVRHTHALSDAEDPARPLSPKGREVALAMGRWLGTHAKPAVMEIWHSPLVRARETAELLAEGAHLKAPLREAAGLLPEDAAAPMATALSRHGDSVMIVGHEPFLSALTGKLLGIGCAGIDFQKGAVLCLERGPRGTPWLLGWYVNPTIAVGDE